MTMNIEALLKILGGTGGMPGTPQEPWNPAAKIVAGLGQPNVAPGAPPPAASSFGGKLGNAVIPQTMAAKGGSNGAG